MVKPVKVGLTIPGDSISQNVAAYLCMIHRLINTPLSKENFSHKVLNIKRIAALNNICINIDKIMMKFTLELGLNSINFLDLTISFVECNDEFHTALSSPNWRKTE